VNDFIADLETELVAAARRRATGRRRRPRPRPRLAPLAAAAAVVLVALAAFAAVRGIDSSGTGDERPATPPPSSGPGVTLTLPAAVQAVGADRCADAIGGYAPSGVRLSVFDRAQTAGDRLGGDLSWLPASMYAPGSVRQVGPGLHLVLAGVTEQPCADQQVFQAGACVIVGRQAGRCFTGAQIASGGAVTTFGGTAYGIVPDGIESVDLSWDGGGASATVRDNAYAVDGVPAGKRVRIESSGAAEGCTPSAAAYDAAPALRLPAEGTPPRALDAAMKQLGSRGEWLAHARHLTTRTGLEIWVAPDMPCDRADQRPERVCLLVAADDRPGPVCDTPADIARQGGLVESGRVVAGFAPAGMRTAEVRTVGSNDVELVAIEHGVFGTDDIKGTVADVRMR
jgi:hypothetical protein